MRQVAIAALIAGACGAPAAPRAVENRARVEPRLRSACPVLDHLSTHRDLWLSAVFPQCAPEPLAYPYAVCGAETCPRPCVMVTMGRREPIHFDERGHWIETEIPQASYGCTYDGDQLATCRGEKVTWRDGRLVDAVEYGEHISIEYTNGLATRYQVIRDGAVQQRITFSYDDRGRLIREQFAKEPPLKIWETTTYEYDADGDMTVRRSNHAVELVTYRDHRPIRVDVTDLATPRVNRTIELAYDARGRLVSSADTAEHGATWTREFEYDCR